MGTFVIGFDLGKEYSQICCWNEKSKEPVSVAVEPGTEKYRIPTETTEAFLKKAMRLLKPYGKIHEAAAVVFCVEQAESRQQRSFGGHGHADGWQFRRAGFSFSPVRRASVLMCCISPGKSGGISPFSLPAREENLGALCSM